MAGIEPVIRRRREPPPLRRVSVVGTERLSAMMTRVVFAVDDLASLMPGLPAGSVRLLVPSTGCDELVIPRWNGNEFLLPDGSRPALRTFTPLVTGMSANEMALEVVSHDRGVVSDWVSGAAPGDPAALSGPGRGFVIDPSVDHYLLVGDASALPAITQLIEELPRSARLAVHVELTDGNIPIELPAHPELSANWHHLDAGGAPGATLIAAVREVSFDGRPHVWAAGEAAAMQSIRRYLFEQLGLPRSQVTIRGYWKQR